MGWWGENYAQYILYTPVSHTACSIYILSNFDIASRLVGGSGYRQEGDHVRYPSLFSPYRNAKDNDKNYIKPSIVRRCERWSDSEGSGLRREGSCVRPQGADRDHIHREETRGQHFYVYFCIVLQT